MYKNNKSSEEKTTSIPEILENKEIVPPTSKIITQPKRTFPIMNSQHQQKENQSMNMMEVGPKRVMCSNKKRIEKMLSKHVILMSTS